MAAEKFPGNGSKPGMYTMPNGDERYYAGGNDFYRSAPGGGAQLFGELTNGSGWRGMSQFDGFNDGRSKGGVAAQNSNPFAPNFQASYSPNDSPLRKVIGPNAEDPNKTPEVTAPVVPTRDVQKASGAKGTQTSPGGGMPVLDAATAAQFLQTQKIGRGAFSSVQLPGSDSNPITGVVPDAFTLTGLESITSGTLGAFSNNGVNFAALDNTGITPEQAFTNPELTKTLGSTYAQYGGLIPSNAFAQQAPGAQKPTASPIKSGRLADALNDTESMRGPETQEGLMRRANAAFLNAKTSQEGLRAKEAVLGQFHAGGQTYQLNDGGTGLLQGENGNPLAMDKAAASSYRLGTSSAQQYKDSYKGKVKEVPAAETPLTPKDAENPFVHKPAAVTKEFTTDVPAGTFSPGSEEEGQQMDSIRKMDLTPPMSSQQISDSFLIEREPMMRDPRKK